MSGDAPEGGAKPNGADSGGNVVAAQRSRFPYLEAFSARGRFGAAKDHPVAYELALGLRIGLATGKTVTLELPRGAPGALLVKMLREAADAIELIVADCGSAANDTRELLPAELAARMPAKGEACALCDSSDPVRFASCRRPGCPVARARAGAPILAPGALATAIADAYTAPAANGDDDTLPPVGHPGGEETKH